MIRLSRHLNGINDAVQQSVGRARGGGLLVLDSAVDVPWLEWYKSQVPDADILFRAWFPEDAPYDAEWRAETAANRAAPIRHLLTGILTTPNEWQQDSLAQMIRAAEYTAHEADLLRARGFSNIIGGAFSTTKPDLRWWPAWVRIAGPHLDGYSGHEYARGLADPGGQLHHQAVWDATPPELRRPVYITEAAFDDDHGGGWRTIGLHPASYAVLMRDYLAHVAPYVKGVYLYQTGAADPKWASWEYAGVPEIEQLFKESIVRSEKPPYVITPREETPMTDLSLYATWSLARIANEEDPLDLAAFRGHLVALGSDPSDLAAYGVPVTGGLPFDAAALAGHLEAVQSLLSPIVAVASRVDAARELLRLFS